MVNQLRERKRNMIGLVLQQELSSVEKPLYDYMGNKKNVNNYPKTIIIPNTDQFFGFGRHDLFERSKDYALVHGEDTYYWGNLTEKGLKRTGVVHYSKNE